jgi:DNA-binding transcriptional MocR family regulator
MVERAYRELEGRGYSRTTLRTLSLTSAKAFVEQTGRTSAARERWRTAVWSLAEAWSVPDVAAAAGNRSTARRLVRPAVR